MPKTTDKKTKDAPSKRAPTKRSDTEKNIKVEEAPKKTVTKKSLATKEDYGNNSIKQLKGKDRVRLRPAVIFGSDGLDGCEHSFFEILSNSVDEAKEGYGNVIRTTVYKDHSVKVEDFGRGIPLGWNENEQQYNWFLIFCELYAGGKYENNDGSGMYEFALGLNGLGACATQYSSEFMKVESYSGGKLSVMNFKSGDPDGELVVSDIPRGGKKSGTIITWRADLAVFKDINIPKSYFEETLKRQAVVNAGVTFTLEYETDDGFEKEEYLYEGIVDRVNELSIGTLFTNPGFYKTETVGRDREDLPDYKVKMEMAFAFSNQQPLIEYYHNSSWLEHGGAPADAMKTAFVSAFDKKIKDLGKYKKGESKISFSEIEESLILVVNGHSTLASYANQTKKAITNKFIRLAMTDFAKQSLEVWFAENPADGEKAIAQVLLNKRSREAANDTRDAMRKKLQGNTDVSNRVEKFVCCRSKDPEKRELYIVEGDSACTSTKLGRNAEFQAIMPVRGKTLNCLKATYDRILKSEIITDLLKVIGCGIEMKSKGRNSDFDIAQLKWNKIIICTDADEDGYQIRALLLTLFYRLLPSLISNGRVYIAESPLFEISAKDDIYFAYNEAEKAKILAELDEKRQKYTVMRSKGLGENEPEMMWKTTMNPASRRLIRVCETDAQKTAELFEMLLGDNIDARKEYISNFGHLYAAQADV